MNWRLKRRLQEGRLLARVSRAAWRLEQADREQRWALASAHAAGLSIGQLAGAVGRSASRVRQLLADADLAALDAALGDLRVVGWPAPEDPDSDEDVELAGRAAIADRIRDEVEWLRRCAGWLETLEAGDSPPVVDLRPATDWPDTAYVVVNLGRVRAVIDRVAGDLDELARARQVADLDNAAVRPDRRAERRRRMAEPDLEFRTFCTRKRLPASTTYQLEHAWDAWQAQRYLRGEIDQWPVYTDNPYRAR